MFKKIIFLQIHLYNQKILNLLQIQNGQNKTENKINYQLDDYDLPELIDNDFNMKDFLASTKYNWKNISLDPFQVIWLGSLMK